MSTHAILESLLAGQDLDANAVGDMMAALCDPEVSPSVKGAMLALLRIKGATGAELAEFAKFLREHSITAQATQPDLLDTCGTGGGTASFNLSTVAAIVVAAAGVPVAKHGNRAMTSKCGSADVLEELGVKLLSDPAQLALILEKTGIAFAFAQEHHPVMKSIGPLRRELGFRTVFNQLGPLTNPFGAKRQLVGVYDRALVRPMADGLAQLGADQALVVHGEDGLDEVSPRSRTFCARVSDGKVEELTLEPSDFGIERASDEALECGADKKENAAIAREALSNPYSPRALAVLPNAASALVLAGKVRNWAEGADLARATIASGAALKKLEEFAAETHNPC
jgi:anthranilate phosphoribosyltransferase